jgi:hypothetical protein
VKIMKEFVWINRNLTFEQVGEKNLVKDWKWYVGSTMYKTSIYLPLIC